MTKEEIIPPYNTYIFHIKECTKEVSKSSGNPMFKVITEIIDEPPIMVDGEQVDINGYEPKPKYVSPLAENQGGAFVVTPKALKAYNEFRKGCGMETTDNPTDVMNAEPSHFVGRRFQALGVPKSEPTIDRATGREIRTKDGDPIMNQSFEVGRLIMPKNS